jgi:hypothetical protein
MIRICILLSSIVLISSSCFATIQEDKDNAVESQVLELELKSEMSKFQARYPIRVGQKYGLINQEGEMMMDAQYDELFKASEGRWLVTKNNKIGLMDAWGKEMIPIRYLRLQKMNFLQGESGVLFRAKDEQDTYIIDSNGQIRMKRSEMETWDSKYEFGRNIYANHLIEIIGSGKMDQIKFGFANFQGEVTQKPIYSKVDPITKELLRVNRGGEQVEDWIIGGEWAIVDHKGEEIVPFGTYGEIKMISEGLMSASKKMPDGYWKWGFINERGEEIVPFQYQTIMFFHNDYAVVSKNKDGSLVYGYVNKEGEEVIELKYSYAGDFSEGFALVSMEDDFGVEKNFFIDKQGKKVLDCGDRQVKWPGFDKVEGSQFKDGIANYMVEEDGKMIEKFMDIHGKEVIKPSKKENGFDENGIKGIKPDEWAFEEYVNRNGDVIWSKEDALKEERTLEEKKMITIISREETDLDFLETQDFGHHQFHQRLSFLLDDLDRYQNENFTKGIVVREQFIILTKRYTEKVVNDLTMKNTVGDFVNKLGAPSLEEKDWTFYKAKPYHIAIHGEQEIQYIVLMNNQKIGDKDSVMKEILIRYLADIKTDGGLFSGQIKTALYEDLEPIPFFQKKFKRLGQFRYISYQGLIVDIYEDTIEVYNNFENDIHWFDAKNLRVKEYQEKESFVKIQFINKDSIFEAMKTIVSLHDGYNQKFETEGVVSPNGKYMFIEIQQGVWDNFYIIRSTDYQRPDFEIGFVASQTQWNDQNQLTSPYLTTPIDIEEAYQSFVEKGWVFSNDKSIDR